MELLRKIKEIPFDRKMASVMLVVMSIQLVFIEGYTISVIKVGIMGVAIAILFLKGSYVNKAMITGVIFWLSCFLASIFHLNFRFSTLGYLGMFLLSYMSFYQLIYNGAFILPQFKQLLKFLLLAFFVTLILQQISVLLGYYNVPLLNLGISRELGFAAYYKWNRLPTLTCEPSHSAIVLAGLMLGYIRCLELEEGMKISVSTLFDKKNRLVTFAYLYLIVFMGSGTGWIGLGILCLYFIRLKSMFYMIPLLIGGFFLMKMIGNKQLDRAIAAVSATMTMDQSLIRTADGSGAMRIVPLINMIKSDFSTGETWFGKGTEQKSDDENDWIKTYQKKFLLLNNMV